MNDLGKFDNERAASYDKRIAAAIPNYDYLMSSMPRYLSKLVAKSSDVKLLVAGCGTGNEMEQFLLHDEKWNITGIDPSPDMVGIARKKLRLFKNQKLLVGKVKGLPDGLKYDAATLSLVLHFLPDNGAKSNLLKSIAQRLAKGAPLIIVDMFGTRDEIWQKLQMLSEILPEEFDAQMKKEMSQRIIEEINYITEDRLMELLELTGFSKPLRYHQSLMYGAWICQKQ